MPSAIRLLYYKIIFTFYYYLRIIRVWIGGHNQPPEAAPLLMIPALTRPHKGASRPLFIRGDKMDWTQAVETIFSVIGQNAFPIVCCVYLLYDKRRSDDQHKQEIDDLRDTMTTALNNNTIALQKLIDKLG